MTGCRSTSGGYSLGGLLRRGIFQSSRSTFSCLARTHSTDTLKSPASSAWSAHRRRTRTRSFGISRMPHRTRPARRRRARRPARRSSLVQPRPSRPHQRAPSNSQAPSPPSRSQCRAGRIRRASAEPLPLRQQQRQSPQPVNSAPGRSRTRLRPLTESTTLRREAGTHSSARSSAPHASGMRRCESISRR
jgi:hypothetical protein